MLEVRSIQTKKEQREICGLCNVEFDPDCLAYGAAENGKLLGVAQFRVHGEYAVIYDLANSAVTEDMEALVIMGKAMLNFIDLCGIKDVMLKTQNQNLSEILGFKRYAAGIYRINLEGYFDFPCKNK